MLFYGGSIFGATALQKSGISGWLPSLTVTKKLLFKICSKFAFQDVIFAKRSFGNTSPLSSMQDSAGQYLSSLEKSGGEHLEKILDSILKKSK